MPMPIGCDTLFFAAGQLLDENECTWGGLQFRHFATDETHFQPSIMMNINPALNLETSVCT